MYQLQLPIPRAYNALLKIASSIHSPTGMRQFALTWLAAARMIILCKVSGLESLDELSTQESWGLLQAEGLPVEGMVLMFSDTRPGVARRLEQAIEVVKALQADLGQGAWDILPTLTSGARTGLNRLDGNISVDIIAPVAELMLDLIGPPNNQTLWVPFDMTGVLTIRALRRGWRVNAASMTNVDGNPEPKLLLAIEYGHPTHPLVTTEISRDAEGRPTTTATHALAIPPFGMLVKGTRLSQWDSADGRVVDQFDRSESMAVYELLHRVTRRAVFLVPSSVLFTRGQEQRLREYILHRGGECDDLDSVIALPPGVYSNTSVSSAILVVGSNHNGTRLVDLGVTKRTVTDIAEIIQNGRSLVLGMEEDETRACFVSRDAIKANDYILVPSRYLIKRVDVGPNSVLLSEVCKLIRPPALTKDETSDPAVEAGIPDLGPWGPLTGPFKKCVRVRASGRDTTSLKPGDIILSLKGTIGKAGLLGTFKDERVVASQSCVGLRVLATKNGSNKLSAEYLLMYLRSDSGQAQLDALKVGATIQSVGLTTLLDSFRVPIGDESIEQAVADDYAKLCALEADISSIEQRIRDISQMHWSL